MNSHVCILVALSKCTLILFFLFYLAGRTGEEFFLEGDGRFVSLINFAWLGT